MHLIAHGSVQTPLESLHWKLTLGEKSLDPPGICVPVLCSTNWATSPPLDLDLISRSQGIRRKKMQVEFFSKFLTDKAQTWHICWDFLRIMCTLPWVALACPRRRGAADAEIKVSSGENTELKHSPFKAWSRSVYSHTCYAYCHSARDFFLAYFYPSSPFTCIFAKTSPNCFSCVGCG